jgi:hypothetical protein
LKATTPTLLNTFRVRITIHIIVVEIFGAQNSIGLFLSSICLLLGFMGGNERNRVAIFLGGIGKGINQRCHTHTQTRQLAWTSCASVA